MLSDSLKETVNPQMRDSVAHYCHVGASAPLDEIMAIDKMDIAVRSQHTNHFASINCYLLSCSNQIYENSRQDSLSNCEGMSCSAPAT